MIGLIGQIVLFAALTQTVGLGIVGWLAGLGYGLVMCAALNRGLHRSGATGLGPADRVTLTRATLVGGVTALVADSLAAPAPVAVLVALAAVALALDAVDGKVARRTGTSSALGARFDMEVDAFLLLVLSVYLARPVGAWVLAIGAMRYAYVAAAWLLPWMHGSLPPRHWRKVVAATQGVVLVLAAADVLPRPVLAAVLTLSLALLIESFGRDVGWLWSHRPVASAPAAGRSRGVIRQSQRAFEAWRDRPPAPRSGRPARPAAAATTPVTLVRALPEVSAGV
jgi:phosphatidylglycerophosphate synthase